MIKPCPKCPSPHGLLLEVTEDNIEHYQCQSCGHKWEVKVSDGK